MTTTERRFTKIKLPRLETEVPDSRYSDLRVIYRTKPRPWLTDVELEPILNPQSVVKTIRERSVRGNWFGVYHRASEVMTHEQPFESPFHEGTTFFRSRVIKHSYLWDEQAFSGTATEVVLERFVGGENNFTDEAALLVVNKTGYVVVEDGAFGESRPGQHLVVRDETGEWVEPGHDVYTEDNRRDFYLLVMGELATR